MTKDEKFVKSVYPRAEIQASGFNGKLDRVVTDRTFCGRWLGKKFDVNDRNKWKNAADELRLQMLRELES